MQDLCIIYSIDKGSPRQTAYCRVNIQVLDINDNPPKFVYPTQMNHTIHFSPWNTPGSPLLKLTAVDNDAGVNAEKIFLIAEGNEKGIFQLDIQTGDLSLKPGLDPLKVAGRYNLKLEVRDDGSPSLSSFTYITVILDASRPPPSPSVFPSGKKPIDHTPVKGPNQNFKPSRNQRDQQLPYTDARRPPTESHPEWIDSGIGGSIFGGEHTLILIICLSAIATMLVLILFIILAWMRRRSLLASTRRGGHRMSPGGQGHLKNVFIESTPRAINIGSSGSWGDGGKMDENLANETLGKRSSPVYWLKASTGSKGALDGKNIHLQPVKSSGSDFSDDTLPPSMFRGDPQQANNCLYATSPARQVVYHNSNISGPAPVITCDNRGDTYLSIPSTSFSGVPTKYIVDFPVGSGKDK
ncbi:unnamed protein product [Rodentolepis nana]|uniref:Cadherin domain-containing protein n=1 Tax=Rodentolepis nana TaxID=102285 RepID=A0A0R3TTV3_RODNA|nr:unnamed protein product [Rodentolepis nana]